MSNLENILTGLVDIDAKLINKVNNISKGLIDPGKYTAFEVTTTENAKTLSFTILTDGALINASESSMGDYNIIIDWGDGTQSHYSNTQIVTKVTGDNQAIWKNEAMTYYKYKFALKRIDISYTHTYTENKIYTIKIYGTTYYQIRHSTSKTASNIVSRCFEYDLPIYSGITRMQGMFQNNQLLTKINCPSYYKWPDNVKDCSQLFDTCHNLLEVGEIILPSTVLSLRRAFYECFKLKTGIYVPDGIINTYGMYANCTLLQYAPNTGKNNRCIRSMFGSCVNLEKIDGLVSKLCRYALGAFHNTPKLINTPKFTPGIIWGAPDGNEAWKDSGNDNYNLSGTLLNLFNKSGIITAPENLGICEASSNIDATNMFYSCKNMTSFPLLPNGIKNCLQTFQNCYQAKNLHRNISGYLDTIPSSVITMDQTFKNCYSLALVQPMPTNIQTARNCYLNCFSITDTGDIFPVGTCSSLTNLDSIFLHCENLIMFSSRIPSSVTNIHSMFAHCQNLKKMFYTYDWLNFNTPIIDFSYAFYCCSNLNKLEGLIPDTVQNANYAFDGCYSAITLPTFHWDINSNCTTANNLYNGCYNLNSTVRIPKKLENADKLCYNCKKLELNVKNLIFYPFTSSNTINISNMFNSCLNLYGSLKLINQLGNKLWNSGKTFGDTSNVFTGCDDSIRIYIPTTWGGLKEVN